MLKKIKQGKGIESVGEGFAILRKGFAEMTWIKAEEELATQINSRGAFLESKCTSPEAGACLGV